MWRPKTLLEAIEAKEDHGIKPDGRGRYICPNCRVIRGAAIIVDVRALPIAEDWACDVCWTHWERHGRVVDDGDKIDGRFDWRLRWVVAHNAPADIIQKFETLAADAK